ncbi:amidohydrolase [bacterium BMS3Abin07]|nr:amidohydrolase [bacterium BMS3Abin07]GBE31423.1 amidohydrolase [bacterium BMS3Bbin05]HDL21252.1 amidohydrolase [Nitrospirota bacterium]HDO22184.1 amidohydrolase [Nitrospirota bacterium]HDZ87346.1 amidohydrolase [Nitrospirota bacterium]
MKVIDFHTHIFPDRIAADALAKLAEHSGEYRPIVDGTLGGLTESMDKAGISLSVVSNIATKPAQAYPIYDFCCEIQNDRIYPLVSIHPLNTLTEAEDILDKGEQRQIRGIKLHPMYQNFYIDDEKMFTFYELFGNRNFFVVFHTGFDIAFPDNRQADVERVRRVADKFRDLSIVVTHTGGWRQWDRIGVLTGCENIYSEISMTQPEVDDNSFIKLISLFDENRIFFGTDSPWTDQKEMVQKILKLKISDSLKEKILFRNASAFMELFSYRTAT